MATNLIISGAIGAMIIASGTALNVSQHAAQSMGQMQNAGSASLVQTISKDAPKTTGLYPFASASPLSPLTSG